MKKLRTILAAACAGILLSSCAITVPYAVTEHPIGSKKGVSKTTVILGTIQLNGDYSVADAAKKGKITGPISTVDRKVTNYILFSKQELIVTGE